MPFQELLKAFEAKARIAQLPTRLSKMGPEELQETVGEFSVALGEIEVLCSNADTHPTAKETQFSDKFGQLTGTVDRCVGKLLQTGTKNSENCSAVGAAYSALIQGMRKELSLVRLKMEK